MDLNLSYGLVMGGIFLTSVAYAYLLQEWQNHFPDSFDDLTWFQVVVGVGYVLLWLRAIVSFDDWITIVTGFFFGCLAIIFRSIWNTATKKKEAKDNGG